jgi:hypothetical protein
MIRRTLAVAVPLAVLALGGCGGGNSPTTPTASPTPSTAPVITFALNPPEGAPSEASSDPGYQYSTAFTLTLTETAGVAVTIRSISANLQQAAGGIVVTPPTGLSEAFRYQVRSPGNQIAANGNITVDFSFFYTLPQPGQEALVTVNFTVLDAAGNAYTQTSQVKVV